MDMKVVAKTRMYTPTQIALATFCSGPLAAIYTLRKNFTAMGDRRHAGRTLAWGIAITVTCIALIPFVPQGIFSLAIALGYTFAAVRLANKLQLTKDGIEKSGSYNVQSNWNVVAVAALSLIGFFVVAGIIFLMMSLLGFKVA
jgi:hypothetical protein